MQDRMIRRIAIGLAALAVLALPHALFSAQANCGRGTCAECSYSPSGEICFSHCNGEVCHYVSCEC